ncbi:MAG: ABC transporter permease [Pseudomarimonas sp.]
MNESADRPASPSSDEVMHEEFFGHAQVTEISVAGRSLSNDLRELWAYRDLLILLVRRDVSVRYKQSAIGIGWAVVQPVMMMLIFSVIFGRFAGLPSEGVPYPLFTLTALLPWLYFAKALSGSSDSLVASANLVKKVYFPRLILPLSKTISGLVDFAVAFGLLVILLAWYRVMPGWELLMLPVLVLIAMLTALSVGLWLTAMNVKYRDIGLMVPFVSQIWMYASPIAYSTTIVPEQWRWIYSLNPMAGVVDGFRWALLGKAPPEIGPMLLSLSIVLVLFVSGIAFFRRTERTFADVV